MYIAPGWIMVRVPQMNALDSWNFWTPLLIKKGTTSTDHLNSICYFFIKTQMLTVFDKKKELEEYEFSKI
jgi:hypothetical protein